MAEVGLTPEPTTAVVLAGGRGSRLGGLEKGEILMGGERLVDIVAAAARESGCERVIIAGDVRSAGAENVREDPPFGGPVAGLAAALALVESEWILLLACDLPHARLLCHLLLGSFREVGPEVDGLVALRDGRVQWLAGFYRRASIDGALGRITDPAHASMQSLLGGLALREVQDPDGLSRDVDTPEDLKALTTREEEKT